MSSGLKQELKAWEAQFRAEHGRDPTKQDIKQQPEIARKYKEYNKAKQAPPTTAAPADVFKTPTKPRTSRQARPAATLKAASAVDDNPFLASSDRSTSTASTSRAGSGSKSDGTRYVLANSPSKLRALAAMHSTSGSPNRPTGINWSNATASTSRSEPKLQPSSSVDPPRDFDRSPRKARNPFASPRKREVVTIQPPSRGTTLFGDFERLEREKLKKKKTRVKAKSGMGWGHASDALEASASDVGSSMEVDEVDDFFGDGNRARKEPSASFTHSAQSGSNATSSQSNPFISPQSVSRTQVSKVDEEDEDDEMLGPSPVKPSSFRRTSSLGTEQSKPFKPLFHVPSPPRPTPTSATSTKPPEPSAKPKLFATSLRSDSIPPPDDRSIRGVKRTNGKSAGSNKELDEADALLDDADDDFYADALDAVEKDLDAKNGRTKGGKRKRVAAAANARAKAKGKGKGSSKNGEMDVEGEEDTVDDDELKVQRDENGGLVLDLRIDGVEDESQRERIVIHQQGRLRGRRRTEEPSETGETEDAEEGPDDFLDASLLDRPLPRAIISSRSDRSGAESQETRSHATLPSELASMLSIRASPQKPAQSAKDLQVAKLLGEPTAAARHRRRGGLLELDDELQGERWDERSEQEEEEGDDDWDEEVDGWKETGEAMDGYYSGRDDW
ncbi:hypothetical protein JCM3766R1_006406 [Sporobolomyces carnicolor]